MKVRTRFNYSRFTFHDPQAKKGRKALTAWITFRAFSVDCELVFANPPGQQYAAAQWAIILV